MSKRKYILTVFIFFSLFLGLFCFIPKSFGSIEDIDYRFDTEELISVDNLGSAEFVNLDYQMYKTHDHYGSYSFTDDVVGNSPLNWDIDEGSGSVEVIPEFVGEGSFEPYHRRVVEISDLDNEDMTLGFVDSSTLYDGAVDIVDYLDRDNVLRLQDDVTPAEDPHIIHYETQATSGARECWIGTSDVLEGWYIWNYDNAISTNQVGFAISAGNLLYFNSHGGWQPIKAVTNNVFYHIKWVWRADNTWDLYVDGIKRVDNSSFTDNMGSGLDRFMIKAYGDSEDYFYLDCYGKPSEFEGCSLTKEFIVPCACYDDNIEFWLTTNDTRYISFIEMYTLDSLALRISIMNNSIYNYLGNGVYEEIILFGNTTIENNTWTHFRFQLGTQEFPYPKNFSLWVNGGSKVLNDVTFFDEDFISYLVFRTNSTGVGYRMYVDAVGFDWGGYGDFYQSIGWLPYTVGMNKHFYEDDSDTLIPYTQDFRFEGDNDPYEEGDSLIETDRAFNEIDTVDNMVQISNDPHETNDRVIEMQCLTGEYCGIGWEELDNNENLNASIIRFLFEIEIIILGVGQVLDIYLKSSDGSLLLQMEFNFAGCFWVDGVTSTPVFSWISIEEQYGFDIIIDFFSDTVTCDFYVDEVYNDTFTPPLLEEGKVGVSNASIIAIGDDGSNQFYIDYAGIQVVHPDGWGGGVFEDGLFYSIIDNTWGYMTYDLDVDYWDYSRFFVFESDMNVSGVAVFSVSGSYSLGESAYLVNDYGYDLMVYEESDYYGHIQFYNDTVVFNPTLVVMAYGSVPTVIRIGFIHSFTSFSISGFYLTDGSNIFHTAMERENVYLRDTYFYVNNITHRLYYEFLGGNEGALEYLQLSFEIIPFPSINRTFSFISDIDLFAKCEVRLIYNDSYVSKQVGINYHQNNVILGPRHQVEHIVILITDNNEDSIISGSGYISDITFFYLENYFLNILTTSLIAMLIPLIMIIFPTMIVYSFVKEKAIAPMLLFMSLICFFSNLIPAWLLVIIVLCTSLTLIVRGGVSRDF